MEPDVTLELSSEDAGKLYDTEDDELMDNVLTAIDETRGKAVISQQPATLLITIKP